MNRNKLKLEALVLSYMTLTRLEELHRNNFVVLKDKQVIGKVIKRLKKKEVLFHQLDEAAGIDNVDEIVEKFENYLKAVTELPFEYMESVTDGINDIEVEG